MALLICSHGWRTELEYYIQANEHCTHTARRCILSTFHLMCIIHLSILTIKCVSFGFCEPKYSGNFVVESKNINIHRWLTYVLYSIRFGWAMKKEWGKTTYRYVFTLLTVARVFCISTKTTGIHRTLSSPSLSQVHVRCDVWNTHINECNVRPKIISFDAFFVCGSSHSERKQVTSFEHVFFKVRRHINMRTQIDMYITSYDVFRWPYRIIIVTFPIFGHWIFQSFSSYWAKWWYTLSNLYAECSTHSAVQARRLSIWKFHFSSWTGYWRVAYTYSSRWME